MHCREHVVQVHHHKETFAALKARVFVVGFEPERRARGWLEQADVTFSFLLDHDRALYNAFELERSIWRSWHPRNLWSYVQALLSGKGLPKIKADPNQLGGDFVIDPDGLLRLAYYSRDATDRPSVEQLLDAIRKGPEGDGLR